MNKNINIKDNERSKYLEEYTPLRLTSNYSWLGMGSLIVGVSSTLLWALLGTISESINSEAITLPTQMVRHIYSSIDFPVKNTLVKIEDNVKPGDTLFLLGNLTNEQNFDSQKANLQNIVKANKEFIIKSPIAGTVLSLNYLKGEYPNKKTSLISILPSSNNKLQVIALTNSSKIDQININNPVIFTPSNVERNIYGGIRGKVIKIKRYPITKRYISNLIGNEEIASNLVASNNLYLFYVQLEKDNNSPTGYKWSSGIGPSKIISIPYYLKGKLTVFTSKRSPITYVFPRFLESNENSSKHKVNI